MHHNANGESLTVRRTGWTFQYSVAKVLAAATAKVDYHTARLAHWRQKYADMKASLPEMVEFGDADDHFHAMTSNMYASPELKLKPEAQRDARQISQKMQEHEGRLQEYTRWQRTLSGQSMDRDLYCTMQDIEFFGLADAPADD